MTIDLPVVEQRPEPQPPTTLVVRYGYLRLLGEFAFDGKDRPACGAKVVIRTKRGTELAEVLATTCANTGCPLTLDRPKMLEYMDSSGGKDYPFSTDGRVLRIAAHEDIVEQKKIDEEKPGYMSQCEAVIAEMNLPMKLVDAEILLGGEMVTFYFLSEHRVDFRGLVKQLAGKFHTRIQMHQVGARDEARLVADYETCGQECCCKHFLKVLRPVNMGSAKMQKATLDPSKISGRCGRLKCCLRYEEDTYDELRKKLPRVGRLVRTADGVGVVEETMILTQLVRVRLDNDRVVAVANEEILERDLPQEARQRREEPREPREGQREGPNGQHRQGRRREQPRPRQAEEAPIAGAQEQPEIELLEAVLAPVARNSPPEAQPPRAQESDQAGQETAVDASDSADQGEGGAGQSQGMGALGRRRRRRGRGRGRGGPNPSA